jgi:uncharacterized protein YhaN
MMKRLRVSSAKGQKFGRFGDRVLALGDHDFIVILGANETGKSSFAEMVAWLLAGRRTEPALGKRLVNFLTTTKTQTEIGGALFGTLGDQDFEVRREFVIKRKSIEDCPLIARVSELSKSETEWKSLIAIKNGDDYFYRYRIISGGPDNSVGIKQLLEAMSVSALTLKTPRMIISVLEEAGKKYCPQKRERGIGGSEYVKSAKELQIVHTRRAEIDVAVGKVNELEKLKGDSEAFIGQAQIELGCCQERKAQLEIAKNAVGLRRDVERARSLLAEKSKPEDFKWKVEAARQDIADRIGALKVDEVHRLRVEQDFNRCVLDADLQPEILDRIQMSTDENEEVKKIEEEMRKIQQAREEFSKQKQEFINQSREANEVLSRKATDLSTSIEQLRQIGLMALDDASFGDPLRQWSKCADDLNRAESRLSELSAKHESAASVQAEAKRAWDKLDQAITPMEAVADSATLRVSSTSGGISKAAYIAIFAITVLGSVIDGRLGALLGLAGVILAIVDVGRAQRRPRGATSNAGRSVIAKHVVSAAQRLNDASSKLEQLSSQVDAAVAQRDNAKSDLEDAKKLAVEVLNKFGFSAATDHLDAVKIRGEREHIKDAAFKFAEATRRLVEFGDKDQKLAASLTRYRDRLRALAAQIGLPEGASDLSAARSDAVLKAKRAQGEYRTAKEKCDDSLAQLARVAGSWVQERSVDAIDAQLQVICDEVKDYRSLEDEARDKADELTSLAPADSEVLKIISEPTFDEESGKRDLAELDDEIQKKSDQITAEHQNIGRIKNELEALATKDDLPEIAMKVAQHSEGVRNALLHGGAYYLAAKIVGDIKSEVEQKSQPDLVREATVIAQRVTSGDWQALFMDSDSPDEMQITQGLERYGQDALSTGAKDALKLCIRLAAARLHAKNTGVALPLILDDPAGSIDADRMSRVLAELKTISSEHQVIVLTHNSETAESIKNLGGHIVHMPA